MFSGFCGIGRSTISTTSGLVGNTCGHLCVDARNIRSIRGTCRILRGTLTQGHASLGSIIGTHSGSIRGTSGLTSILAITQSICSSFNSISSRSLSTASGLVGTAGGIRGSGNGLLGITNQAIYRNNHFRIHLLGIITSTGNKLYRQHLGHNGQLVAIGKVRVWSIVIILAVQFTKP